MAYDLEVYFDGGSRGNPGTAGYGAVVFDAKTSEKLAEVYGYLGEVTNNNAEYNGLIAGLKLAFDINPNAYVKVYADSKLVVEQMSGRWKIKDSNLATLAGKAFKIFPQDKVSYTWIPRSENSQADKLANIAMDTKSSDIIWNTNNTSEHNAEIVSSNGVDIADNNTHLSMSKEYSDLVFVNISDDLLVNTGKAKAVKKIVASYNVTKVDRVVAIDESNDFCEEIAKEFDVEVAEDKVDTFVSNIYDTYTNNSELENLIVVAKTDKTKKIVNSLIQAMTAKYNPLENTLDILSVGNYHKKNVIHALGIIIN